MRQPTPEAELYAWHAASVGRDKADRPGVTMGEPECGWFRRRLVKGGPWVPAIIWCRQEVDPETGELTEPAEFICEVDGTRRNPFTAWNSIAGNPITAAAYAELCRARHLEPARMATLARYDLTRNIGALIP